MKTINWVLRFLLLYVLFLVAFVLGSLPVASLIPENATSEPGLVPGTLGLLLIAGVNVLIISALILISRWSGWKLAISLALAYYGTTTFLMQIESWFFLSTISVDGAMIPRLFLMGVPTAFIFIPLAVWILGKGKKANSLEDPSVAVMPPQQWFYKLSALSVLYLLLYWFAGYFIAWQNPELRAFYGSPGDALPFFTHTVISLREQPELFLLQLFRGVLWACCALAIIRSSRVNVWWTALWVGLLFSLPQNLVHLLANPLMPLASIRFSHMIETALSTFVFGLLVVWLLHRRHYSWRDLFKPYA